MSETLETSSGACTGALTIQTAAEQYAVLRDLMARGLSAFDLSGVTEFDTAGVQILLAAAEKARTQGKALALHSAAPCVREILARYGLETLCTNPATGEDS